MNHSPNIIVCQCDQLRAFNLGCYGDPVVRTPNIDRLASTGTRFETAITNNPVCTPARSSLLSGQYSRTCAGMLGNVLKDPPNPERVRLVDPTLPEILRDRGYSTALTGKWHVDPRPQLVGFDSALYPKIPHRYYGQTVFDENNESRVIDGFLEDYFAERVREFLSTASSQPFFLHYNISPPHQPIGPGNLPDVYTRMYQREDIELRSNTCVDSKSPDSRFWFNVYSSADFFWRYRAEEPQDPSDLVPDGFDLTDLTRLYYGAVTCVDDQVGRLMHCLGEFGLDENTVVVFVSDHGDNLGSHGLFNKNSLIEESVRIPLVVRDPRVSGGRVDRDNVASIIDIMPTLLDLAGVEIPTHVQGVSLLPSIRENAAARVSDKAFVETGAMIGIRTSNHLYGVEYDERTRKPVDGETWFYDLAQDPMELSNLAGKEAVSGLEEELRKALLEWDSSTPWLDAPPHVPEY